MAGVITIILVLFHLFESIGSSYSESESPFRYESFEIWRQ